ncbi:MAG: response regulator [Ignavibacteriae bacterium]|nr:MAG: response regulator [Ignavibacteriota bacterium]
MITEKILVVDDEATVCSSIQKILTKRGYSVDNSLNADDAILKIKNNKFDLVITDLMMPGTDGMELLQIIKQHYPELDVIVITGYASIDTAVKATKLGAMDYLPKPFTPEELTEITKRAIEKRKMNVSKKAEPKSKIKPALKKNDNIDIDMPFSESEVESHTSKEFVDKLSRSDIPQQKKPAKKTEFCNSGQRECRRLVLEGRECTGECPIVKKERERAAKATGKTFVHTDDIIDVDMPFNYSEVERIMGSDYINCMDRSEIPRAGLFGRDSNAKHNVLVVDDEPIVCHSLRKILTKQSCSVEEAFDVDAALLKMRLNKYDLIFLDLKMPKSDGMELLKSIKNLYPEIPVVMISGYASIKTAVEATREGAFNFIPKPFTPEELKVVTREALAA